jgi:hypothetical protein
MALGSHAQIVNPDQSSERRLGPDRRRPHPLFGDWRFAFGGRRLAPRRTSDPQVADYYQPRLLFVSIGILLLSAADATLTLALLESGIVREANPLMRLLLEHDVQVFVNVKTAITCSAMLILVPAHHYRVMRRLHVRYILYALFVLYSALILYELALLDMVARSLPPM